MWHQHVRPSLAPAEDKYDNWNRRQLRAAGKKIDGLNGNSPSEDILAALRKLDGAKGPATKAPMALSPSSDYRDMTVSQLKRWIATYNKTHPKSKITGHSKLKNKRDLIDKIEDKVKGSAFKPGQQMVADAKLQAAAADDGSYWSKCRNNPVKCAVAGALAVGATALGLSAALSAAYGAVAAAYAVLQSAVAGAVWWFGASTAAAVFALSVRAAVQLATYEAFKAGKEYASMSDEDLNAKIAEIEANQCYVSLGRASCAQNAAALETAIGVRTLRREEQARVERRVKKYGRDGPLWENMNDEERKAVVEKRKARYFIALIRKNTSADAMEQKARELEANGRAGLRNLIREFNQDNARIFQQRDARGKLLFAGLTAGRRGVLRSTLKNDTQSIVKALAIEKKALVKAHMTAVDTWCRLSSTLEEEVDNVAQHLTTEWLDTYETYTVNGLNPSPLILKVYTYGVMKARGDTPSRAQTPTEKEIAEAVREKIAMPRNRIDERQDICRRFLTEAQTPTTRNVVANIVDEQQKMLCFVVKEGDLTAKLTAAQSEQVSQGENADSEYMALLSATLGAFARPSAALMAFVCQTDFDDAEADDICNMFMAFDEDSA